MRCELVQTLPGHDDRVWCVAWSADGKWLASCSGDRSLRLWGYSSSTTTTTMECVCALTDAHEKTVRRIAWHPRLTRLAAASFDGTASVWEPEPGFHSWVCAATLEGHDNEVKSVAWDSTGRHLATCGRDKSVWVWATDEQCREFDCMSVLHGHAADVKTVAWAGAEAVLLSASYDNSVREWRAVDDDWACSATLEGHSSTVWDIAFEPHSNTRMATASDDSRVLVWERNSSGNGWRAIHTLPAAEPGRPVYSVAWSPHSPRIATGAGDNTLRVFVPADDDAGWKEAACVVVSAADVNSVAWSPIDPDLLAVASDDNLIRLYRITC